MSDTVITPAWCEANGFRRDDVLGYVRHLSDGPGDASLDLCIGTYPFNDLCVCLVVGGYGVVTNAGTVEEILALVRLFDGARIDHPYEAWIDGDEDDEDDE